MIAPDVDYPLREALEQAGLDSVAGALAFGGGDDLIKDGLGHRRRTRLVLADSIGRTHELYMKRYGPEPMKLRLRRAWTHGRGKSPATVEAQNVAAVAAAGIATMRYVAAGQDHAGRSYVIITAVPGDALSRMIEAFAARHQSDGQLEALTERLADVSAKLHEAGLAHRDFYADHIFLHEMRDGFELYLIDLARMFRPRWRRHRWFVKDLAQLKFSMPAWWIEKHWPAFLGRYLTVGGSRMCGHGLASWDRIVGRKVRHMQAQAARRAARKGAGG